MSDSRERLRAAVLEVVENQIRDGTPPETRQTIERLQREGVSADDAKSLIAALVAAEIFSIAKDKRPFDERRFVECLHKLPALPWDDDEGPNESR